MKPFYFKHFSIQQQNSALKVGTDAMLLGSLCDFTGADSVLDIGTGTGVLSLMVAQRFSPETITAVEIDPLSSADAEANFRLSPFSSKFELINGDLRKTTFDKQFDGIITNPPYFENSTKSTGKEKQTAKHTDELSYQDLIASCSSLLSSTGIVWMILPHDKAISVTEIALESGLYLLQNSTINGKPGKPVRSVLCFGRELSEVKESILTVRNADGTYSSEYIELTKDFHGVDLNK